MCCVVVKLTDGRKSNSKIYSFLCSKVWFIAILLSPTFHKIDCLISLLKEKIKTTSFLTLTPTYKKYSRVNKFSSLINFKIMNLVNM